MLGVIVEENTWWDNTFKIICTLQKHKYKTHVKQGHKPKTILQIAYNTIICRTEDYMFNWCFS